VTRDLNQRLVLRRAIEELHHKGQWARGRGDFLLRHDDIVAPILRTALRIAGLYGRGTANALRPEVRHRRFAFPDLPEGFDGFRLLHLTDLHIDGVDGLAEIVAESLSALPVDLCVLTGDYRFHTKGPCEAVYSRMRTILGAVRSRHGIVGILGNHDAAEMALELEKQGVRMLINESVEVRDRGASLWILGVDDPHYFGCDDLDAALVNVPAGAFEVLLAHTPEMYEAAAGAGIRLYLCGHTHGGQVCLPRIGAPLLNARCPRALARGAWQHAGVQGYTSAGIGCSMLPVRYNCPPEIAVIELGRAENHKTADARR